MMQYLLGFLLFLNFARVYSNSNSNSNNAIITDYIGKWNKMRGAPNIFIYSGYGTTINMYDNSLSTKKLQRTSGYAYRKHDNNANTTYYNVFFETVPNDGNYWFVQLYNISTNYYKYSIYYNHNGGSWIWGQESEEYLRVKI